MKKILNHFFYDLLNSCNLLVNVVFSLNFKQRLFLSSIFERFYYDFWNLIRKDNFEINGLSYFNLFHFFILFFFSGLKRKAENMLPSEFDGSISQMSTPSSTPKISTRRESGQPATKK